MLPHCTGATASTVGGVIGDAGAALPREQACYSLDRLLRRVGYICVL